MKLNASVCCSLIVVSSLTACVNVTPIAGPVDDPSANELNKRAQTVVRYHNAIVNQLILASPEIPADHTADDLRGAEKAMISGCSAVDQIGQAGIPAVSELDRCEEASARVDLLLRGFLPGQH